MQIALDRIVKAYISKRPLTREQESFLRDELAAFIVQLLVRKILTEN
jgi:hypothetical protein